MTERGCVVMSAMEKMDEEQNDRGLFVCLFVCLFSPNENLRSQNDFFSDNSAFKQTEGRNSLHSMAVNCRTPCSGGDAEE